MHRTVVVIGGVAAGASAASKAARTGTGTRVILLEQSDTISYGICEIPYYVGGEVSGEDLVIHTPESLKREKGVDVRILHRVEEIRPGRRMLRVRDLGTGLVSDLGYDKLIVATGARPLRLGIPGEDARNVFPVRTLDGAHALRRFVDGERPRRAVIIGAGFIGVELAEAFVRRNLEVTLLEKGDLPVDGMFLPAREAVRDVLLGNGVRFVPGAAPVSFAADTTGAVSHVLAPHTTYPADLVVVAAGVVPNTELAVAAGIRTGRRGGILTDRRQQTSADGVFAAGDCCEVRNLVTNGWMYAPLATNASRAGWVAGTNAAGGSAAFNGALGSTAVRVFSLEAAQVGLTEREALDARLSPVTESIVASSRIGFMPGSRKITVTLMADRTTGRLLGASFFGEEGAVVRSHALAIAIQQRMTVDALRASDLAYAPPFSPLWDPILVAANALARTLTSRTRA